MKLKDWVTKLDAGETLNLESGYNHYAHLRRDKFGKFTANFSSCYNDRLEYSEDVDACETAEELLTKCKDIKINGFAYSSMDWELFRDWRDLKLALNLALDMLARYYISSSIIAYDNFFRCRRKFSDHIFK